MYVFKICIYPHKIPILITILYGFNKVCQQENGISDDGLQVVRDEPVKGRESGSGDSVALGALVM